MTGIADNLGNSIAYTLDTMCNRTAEALRDPASVLAQTRARVINSLNRQEPAVIKAILAHLAGKARPAQPRSPPGRAPPAPVVS